MNWYPDLYIGMMAQKKKNKIISNIQHQKTIFDVYLITLAANPLDLLDIVNANFIRQPALGRQPLYIVGIACGYREALDVVLEIVNDIYQETKEAAVREYLLEHWTY